MLETRKVDLTRYARRFS